MKTSSLIIAGAAVGAGVLGALQIDHFLQNRQSGTPLLTSYSSSGIPVALGTSNSAIAPAPFDFRLASKRANQSVVAVDRFEAVNSFFDSESRITETGQGSGVIVSANGTIVTNNHVVADSNGQAVAKVKIHLSDNRVLDARVLGTDPRSDLAVLKVDAKDLTPIELAESKDVEVGQWVLAVGNPLGFANTVSVGVVSSLKRNLPVGGQGLVDAIQTDAAINPGNSGGALCDAQGRLIGINSAIASSTGQSVGIGFAIPVDRVKSVVNDIVKYGYARYAGLGITYNPNYDGVLADQRWQYRLGQATQSNEVPDSGIIVMDATDNARKVGINKYSVLLELDGQKVEGSFDLNKILVPKKPGDVVKVKFWDHGQIKSTNVKLQESRPQGDL